MLIDVGLAQNPRSLYIPRVELLGISDEPLSHLRIGNDIGHAPVTLNLLSQRGVRNACNVLLTARRAFEKMNLIIPIFASIRLKRDIIPAFITDYGLHIAPQA